MFEAAAEGRVQQALGMLEEAAFARRKWLVESSRMTEKAPGRLIDMFPEGLISEV